MRIKLFGYYVKHFILENVREGLIDLEAIFKEFRPFNAHFFESYVCSFSMMINDGMKLK